MSKENAQGFDVTEYDSDGPTIAEKYAVIAEIATYQAREVPNMACRVSMVNDCLRVAYHTYEMHLPRRMREVQEAGDDHVKEFIKMLKKEFKERTGKALNLKERKDSHDYSVEKVSLNERYHYACWCLYDIG